MHRYEFHESDNNWWHSKSKTNVKAVAWKQWMIKEREAQSYDGNLSCEGCRVSYPLSVTILFLRHFLKLNLILFFLSESLTVDKLTNRAHNAREYYNWKSRFLADAFAFQACIWHTWKEPWFTPSWISFVFTLSLAH